MPFGIEQQRWGLKKESVRLTAESAPNVWFAVDPTSYMNLMHKPIPDKTLRGIKAPYVSFPGPQDVNGECKFPLRAKNCGEFFVSLLGDASDSQQGGTAAYLHTFVTPPTNFQPTTYTIFVDRNINVMKYNGCAVKSVKLAGNSEGACEMTAAILGINEVSGSIGSPSYSESEMLEFYQTTVKIGGAANTNPYEYELTLDNGLFQKRAFNQSQQPVDVIAAAKMKVSGKIKIWFESDTERQNYIALTTQSYEFILKGSLIASTFFNQLDLLLPKCVYTGYKFAQDKDLLTAEVDFEAVYDAGNTNEQYALTLTNTIASY